MHDPILQLIDSTNDIEAVRRMARLQHEELRAMGTALKKAREERDIKELEKQEWLDQSIKLRLHRLQRVAFGFGRETNKHRDRERVKTERQLTLQNRSLVGEIEEVKSDSLPEEEQIHLQDEETLLEQCHLSGLVMNDGDQIEIEQIAHLYEESTEITVTKETFRKVIYKRAKYKARNLSTGDEKILTARGPVKLYPKAQFSVDFALSAVTQKFLNFLPYERQRREMRRSGLNIPTVTLCRLESGVTAHLESVAEKIREDILSTKHLAVGLDETKWPILLGKDKGIGYFWIICNQAGSYYRFEPTRSGQIAMELLKDFRGSVISDKFGGYLQFIKNENINWGLCLAHARRDFASLQKVDVNAKDCGEVLSIMDKVFAIEHETHSWEELSRLRKEKTKKLMEELKVKLEELADGFFHSEDMGKAIYYILNSWDQFMTFIKDVKLPVSNNESERALRQVVLGRKNYRGSNSIDAADRAAVMFTIIESCKKAELDPEDYIRYVIEENHHGREALTPLKLALSRRGKSDFWPETNRQLLSPTGELKK